jgi:hypothetical protein
LHLANRILRWVKRTAKTDFTKTDVYQTLKTSAAKQISDFDTALARLVEHNYLNHSMERTNGRPLSKYKVNPAFLNES